MNNNLVINQDQKIIFINFFNMIKRYIINNYLSEMARMTNQTVDQLYQRVMATQISLSQDIGSYLARYEELKNELNNNNDDKIEILNEDIDNIKDNLAELSWQDNENNEFSAEDRIAIEEISRLIGFDKDPEDKGLDNKYFRLYQKYKLKYLNLKKTIL